jgi:Clp amino terminal domain, pathogenicity island component
MTLPQANAVSQALERARQEARALGHDHLGTEHVLLGLADDEKCLAAVVLARLGVELPRLRLAVGKTGTPVSEALPDPPPDRDSLLTMTPGLTRALEHASSEARAFGQETMDTEHLLLGLLKEEDGIACQVLASLGVSAEDVRKRVAELRGQDYQGWHMQAEAPLPGIALPPPPRRPLAPSGRLLPAAGRSPGASGRLSASSTAEQRLTDQLRELERVVWEQQVFLGGLAGALAGVFLWALVPRLAGEVTQGLSGLGGLVLGGLLSATGRPWVGALLWGLLGLVVGYSGALDMTAIHRGVSVTLGGLAGLFVGVSLCRTRRPS